MDKKRDWKFIFGTAALVAVLVFICAFFWKTVAEQAELVRQEEALEEENALQAIYMYAGDVFKIGVFVDMETKDVFQAQVPKEGIVNRNGVMIAGDVLEEGDKVRIYGKLEKTQDTPPVYNGITKMQRDGRATLEEAQEYRELLNGTADNPKKRKTPESLFRNMRVTEFQVFRDIMEQQKRNRRKAVRRRKEPV